MAVSLSYTTGNWAVSSLITDTIAVAKNISVVDLDYANDFAKTKDEPTEAIIANTTASTIVTPEKIRYGSTPVSNIYTGAGIESSSQIATKGGVQVLVEVRFNLTATNSVSGAEVLLPVTSRLVLKVPTAPCITDAAVLYALKRVITASFATGNVADVRILDLVRGSLIPEGV